MANLALMPNRKKPGWLIVVSIREKLEGFLELPVSAIAINVGPQEFKVRNEKWLWSEKEVSERNDLAPYVRQLILARNATAEAVAPAVTE